MANSPAKALSYEDAYKKIKNPKQSKAEFIKAAKAYNTKKYGTTNPTKDAKDQGLTGKAALADQFKKSQVEKKNKEAVSGTMRSKVDKKETTTTPPPPPKKDTRTPEQIVNDKKLKIAKDAMASGDRKAGEAAGFKGREKRVANKGGRKKDRELRKDDKEANKYEAKAGKEKSDKKKAIEYEGSRKAARLMDKSDAAKKAESSEVKKYGDLDFGKTRGKDFTKASKKLGKAEAKSDKIGSKLKKEQKKVVEKSKKENAEKAPTTFKDFNQMDTVNAEKTAGESSMSTMYSDGPIKYFKQSIKYDVKEATNPNLTSSARKHYSMNAEADMKSMAPMYDAPSKMYDAPTKMRGNKKSGSILSKHMKS